MLPSNMLLLNLIPLIDVTFSTPTPDYDSWARIILGMGALIQTNHQKTERGQRGRRLRRLNLDGQLPDQKDLFVGLSQRAEIPSDDEIHDARATLGWQFCCSEWWPWTWYRFHSAQRPTRAGWIAYFSKTVIVGCEFVLLINASLLPEIIIAVVPVPTSPTPLAVNE